MTRRPVIVLAAVWAVILPACCGSGPPAPAPPQKPAAREVQSKKTAQELLTGYRINEVLSDGALKGQWIEVSGTVERIAPAPRTERASDIHAGPRNYVVFKERDDKSRSVRVLAYFPPHVVLTSLRPDMKLTVRGECAGMVIRDIHLKDCVIAE